MKCEYFAVFEIEPFSAIKHVFDESVKIKKIFFSHIFIKIQSDKNFFSSTSTSLQIHFHLFIHKINANKDATKKQTEQILQRTLHIEETNYAKINKTEPFTCAPNAIFMWKQIMNFYDRIDIKCWINEWEIRYWF